MQKKRTFAAMIVDYRVDLSNAVDVLRRGGVILYPTDTIWGIGCDATNADAVAKVYAIKRRVDNKALITLVGSMAMLERTVGEIPDAAEQLIDAADHPVTIIYDRAIGLAPNLIGHDGSVGVRLTVERFSRDLCLAMRRPVVSTSANISGQPSPACFADIDHAIIDQMDYVVSYRRDDMSPSRPSSVIKISADNSFKIIRK